MNLDRNPWISCAGRAALALMLVLTAGCGDDGGGTDGDDSKGSTSGSTSSTPTTTTTEPTGTTDATTGDESSESGSGETSAVEVDYMDDIQPIWDMRCVNGCHVASGAAANGPILTEDKSYDELVDAKSKTVTEFVQVKPGDPELSYLWHKINGTQANVGGLGSPMPLGGMLSAEDLAKIEAWITAGAKP